MNLIEKYKLYREIQTTNAPVQFSGTPLHSNYETSINGNVQIFSEKRDPDYCGEGVYIYTLAMSKKDKSFTSTNGLFARLVYKLLQNKYQSKNGKNR